MPTSGVIGNLRVVVLLNTVLVHLGTVCFYEDAPAITALQQEAIMSPDMIVDAGVISCGITARGAVSKSGGLSAIHPPRVLLANGVVLMDAIQPYLRSECQWSSWRFAILRCVTGSANAFTTY